MAGYDTSSAKQAVAGLAGRMPVANRRAADAIERERQKNISAMTGAAYNAGGPGVTSGDVSAAGAGMAAQAGQAQVAAAKGQQELAGAAGQTAISGMGRDLQNQSTEAGLGLAAQQRSSEDRLANLNMDLKRQLVDDRMSFQKDQNGRLVANTQQMADLAVVKAKDQAELMKYRQTMDQATRKHVALLKTMYSKMQQELQSKTSKEIQDMEQETKVNLQQAMADLQGQIQARETEMANRSMQSGAVGGILGAVGGGILGGPEGMKGGAKGGQALGSASSYA